MAICYSMLLSCHMLLYYHMLLYDHFEVVSLAYDFSRFTPTSRILKMASTNSTTLEAMWSFMATLTPTTPDAELQALTKFYEPTATVYLNGMTQLPCTSHESLIATTKALMTYWALSERKVTSHVETGGIVVNTMLNKLLIMGELVEDFHECEVVTFSERGLVQEYLLYCDPSPIMKVFAKGA